MPGIDGLYSLYRRGAACQYPDGSGSASDRKEGRGSFTFREKGKAAALGGTIAFPKTLTISI